MSTRTFPKFRDIPFLSLDSVIPSVFCITIIDPTYTIIRSTVWKKTHVSAPQPLTGLQANGPGLLYKVMWRQQDVEEEWTSVSVANVSKFVVSGTPTFVPYEVKVQAQNDYGHGPKPAAVIGYSGEDCESLAFSSSHFNTRLTEHC